MAHERLSPRQKMIGMMYLVLTAMLALNVSKDAVEAFKNIDNGLTLTVRNYAQKNNLIYQDFEASFAQYPNKTGPYRSKALLVKERADEVFYYLQGLKKEIIITAEGEDSEAVQGDEIIIDKVEKIDDNNVPSQILIGANDDGKAFALRTMINDYREILIETLAGENPTAEEALKKSLNTDDVRTKDAEVKKWPNHNFQALPLVYVITMLSKIQVDVRNAETEVINHLFAQIDKSNFKFNKLGAVVIPKSNYVTLGSNYEATVFLSAIDSTSAPTITVGDQILELDESGKGIYTARATSRGNKSWGGLISIKAPDGTTSTYDFAETYFVDEANVVVSPTAMNVMYVSIPNPIDVSVPGVSPNNISIRVVNGSFTTEKVRNAKTKENFRGSWAVRPNTAGQNVQIVVTATDGGKKTQYPPVDFRVKSLPKPEPRFAGLSSGKITKTIALNQKGVFATLPDFDFDLTYEITNFSVIYTDRLGDMKRTSTSSTITAEQREVLDRLTRGKFLNFTDIKAKGPDGRTVDLLPMIFEIE